MSGDRVLVTGASGFIAKHCIAELLKSGYLVRGTVRSLSRRGEVEAAVKVAGVAEPDIDLVEADLLDDAGWAEAMAGCRYVLHVASPFPRRPPSNPDDLIKPARDGAVRVLTAAATAGVERVVQTSSIAAIMRSGRPDAEARTEEDWATDSDLGSYARSKTLAERAAWETMDKLSASSSMQLATINPGLVLGPALDRELSTSHDLVRLLGRRAYRAIPDVSFPVVDARDVAKQHVLAMTHPSAAGERWLCTNGTLSMRRIGKLIIEAVPDLAGKVPLTVLPDAIIRIAAFVRPDIKGLLPDLGRANLTDSSKAVAKLGMEFRSPEEAVMSTAKSLRELGVI